MRVRLCRVRVRPSACHVRPIPPRPRRGQRPVCSAPRPVSVRATHVERAPSRMPAQRKRGRCTREPVSAPCGSVPDRRWAVPVLRLRVGPGAEAVRALRPRVPGHRTTCQLGPVPLHVPNTRESAVVTSARRHQVERRAAAASGNAQCAEPDHRSIRANSRAPSAASAAGITKEGVRERKKHAVVSNASRVSSREFARRANVRIPDENPCAQRRKTCSVPRNPSRRVGDLFRRREHLAVEVDDFHWHADQLREQRRFPGGTPQLQPQ